MRMQETERSAMLPASSFGRDTLHTSVGIGASRITETTKKYT